MLTQLTTVKNRLAIAPDNTTNDGLLVATIEAVGMIFQHRCQRALARTAGAQFEFNAGCIEICVPCYPIESVSTFEVKTTEAAGWVAVTQPEYLIRSDCVISLATRLGTPQQQARVTYTGGYVLPGSTVQPGQKPLPADLEHAAVEQVAAWFTHRDKIGLVRYWPSGGIYQQFIQQPLLPIVEEILLRHERWVNG